MFATAPVLVLKRTLIIRVVLCLFVLLLALLSLRGVYASLQEMGRNLATRAMV